MNKFYLLYYSVAINQCPPPSKKKLFYNNVFVHAEIFLYNKSQCYLNVLQQLLLAPADVLQLLLLLRGEVLRHWQNTREREREQQGQRRLNSDATVLLMSSFLRHILCLSHIGYFLSVPDRGHATLNNERNGWKSTETQTGHLTAVNKSRIQKLGILRMI